MQGEPAIKAIAITAPEKRKVKVMPARGAAKGPPVGAAIPVLSEAEVKEEKERELTKNISEQNVPLPCDRLRCNKHGELVTASLRCTANNRRGTRCKARTCNNHFCYTHLDKEMGLRIKKSDIPGAGRGLFATRDFRPDENITGYSGDISDDPDVDHGGSIYVMGISERTSVDAARRNTMPGRLINDPVHTGKESNCTWVIDRNAKKVRVKATKAIKKGDEILISYGPGYWAKHEKMLKRLKKGKQGAPAVKGMLSAFASSGLASTVSAAEKHQLLFSRQAPSYLSHAAFKAASSTPATSADPFTYQEAINSAHANLWREAMQREQESLRLKDVYEILDHPPKGARVLGTKWVFKRKEDENGKIQTYKARVVCKGFLQTHMIDYTQTFAATLNHRSLRLLFAVAAFFDLEIKSLDVITAYLNAPLTEEIYIQAPPGFTGPAAGKTLRLNKALYGLKQAAREWNHTLMNQLKNQGFKPCEFGDSCVLVKLSKSRRPMIIAVFVDDIPHFYHKDDEEEMEKEKKILNAKFPFKDLGNIKMVVGFRVYRDRKARSLWIDQHQYTEKLLKLFGMMECKSDKTPEQHRHASTSSSSAFDSAPHVSASASSSSSAAANNPIRKETYRTAVGGLLYLAQCTRPDIAHAVGMAARNQENPTDQDLLAVKRILRYLSGTSHLGIKYSRQTTFQLAAYSDADWGGKQDLYAHSTSGGVLFLACGPISWLSKKQSTIALSTAESEYTSGCELTKEVIWARVLLAQIGFPQPLATPLFIDNRVAISMGQEEGNEGRRKHINIKYHWIREQVSNNMITLHWVETSQQIADILTKSLPAEKFESFRNALMSSHPSS